MPLANLPNEIIICIAEDHLSDASDVFSLLLTCRLFASLLPGSLDRLAVTSRYVKQALCFAAAHQKKDKLEVLLQRGQQPHALRFIEERPESSRSVQEPSQRSKQLVRYIMDQGANLVIRDFSKRVGHSWTTLLHFSVRNQHVGMVEALLAKGANTGALDANGLTALQLATSIRDVPLKRPNAIVKLLLEHGADATAESTWGTAPIALAVMSGNAYQVGLMPPRDISKRFRVSGENERWGVLNLAIYRGRIDIARVLIEKGADLNMRNDIGTPLHHAVRGGNLELAKLLIDKGAPIDKGGAFARTPLHIAVLSGQEMINLLLDHGASINLVDSRGWTALHSLVSGCPNPQLIKLLVERGADLTIQDDEGATPLHVAIGHCMGANAKTILDLTPDECLSMRDHSGDTPLHAARWAPGAGRFVKHLLLRDPDITFFSGDGTPALQLAVSWGDSDLVERILARYGPKHPAINARNSWGRTALHRAARKGYKAITELLVAYGADISIRDCAYQTALHYAARFSAVTAGILLAAGASVEARDANGRTPLHYVSKDAKRAAYLLIEWGADVTVKDNLGVTVPDWVSNEYHSLISAKGKLSSIGELKAGRRSGSSLLLASSR